MNTKENITLIKGFGLRKDGHLFCNDFDFGHIDEVVGKTFTLDDKEEDLVLCERGFHACDCIGKVDLFYRVGGKNHRFFKISVKKAFFKDAEKFVFKSFTVKEPVIQGLVGCNTGDRNTGDWNTGDRNTGDRNTGRWNAGDRNTGRWNVGDRNTGDWNTGDRNLTNHSSGFFAFEEQKTSCFGKPTEYSYKEFRVKFQNIITSEPCFDNLMKLPNANRETVELYLEKWEELKKKEKRINYETERF